MIRVFIMENIDMVVFDLLDIGGFVLHLGVPQNITLNSLKNFENHIVWWYDFCWNEKKIVTIDTYFSKKPTQFIKGQT